MTKVSDVYWDSGTRPAIICDFTPPRGIELGSLSDARDLNVDFISVAYNPGAAVCVDSAMFAYVVKRDTGKDVVFTVATRDMNRLALQSYVLGCSTLGLENILVVGGDPFSQADLKRILPVNDFNTTDLMRALTAMNQGLDFRGRPLSRATDLCIGGAVDLARNMSKEAILTNSKIRSGAQYFVTQPIFDASYKKTFEDTYLSVTGNSFTHPIFYGLQILVNGGVKFGPVPDQITKELRIGRDGVDIALELWGKFKEAGIAGVYLMPPIEKGGIRDYEATRRFLELAC